VTNSDLSPAAKNDLIAELDTKEDQFEKAANLAAGVQLQVVADVAAGKSADNAFMAVPGQSFNITARFSSRSPLEVVKIELDLPSGWKAEEISDVKGLGRSKNVATFRVTVSKDARYTRPYWHRDDPERDAINSIDNPQDVTLPFSPPPVRAHAIYAFGRRQGIARATAMVKYAGDDGRQLERAVGVAPAFSVMLEPGEQVINAQGDSGCKVRVSVSSNSSGAAKGSLHLEIPAGWRVEPASLSLEFRERGDKRESEFTVFPASLREGRTEIRAVFNAASKGFSEGYSVVTREDLDTFYYYQPALLRVSIAEVKLPKGLKVGYIMGAGDDIPTVLKQVGMDVTVLGAEQLASADLSPYGTIVLGIRAYDTQKDLAANNKKLLDWVSAGGTLVVQYNASVGDFNKGNFTPYPATLSRARVSVEDAPVQVLAPDDSVFTTPNKITEKDFEGWVQERGLYFMDHWDDHFKPLLACHDPGESAQKGGLLRAQYGKGTYIYTGYAFFRQLPAGVPGAIRLYVNLLSSGRQ